MMAEAFDSFNAPQFVDFSKPSDSFEESLETYFDVDHENERKERNLDRSDASKNSECTAFYSPIDETLSASSAYHNGHDPLEQSYEEPVTTSNLRKSMSVGNLVLFHEETQCLENIREHMNQLDISHSSEDNRSQITTSNKQTSGSSATSYRGNGSQDHLNKLAQPKRYASIENLNNGNNGKYVSLAEAINKFQNKTPVRFRSKPKLAQNHTTLQRTVPESPALQTKARSRPIHILSQEEREQIELENIRRFKIKAQPVNKKVLEGPMKPPVVEKKPPTKPEPFNITGAQPKKAIPSPEKYHFQARPMPRSTVESKQPTQTERRPLTKAKTPSFMKNYKPPVYNSEENLLTKEHNKTNHKDHGERKLTKPKPFSFERRDKMVQERREKLINKIREEERKAREFHARPIPKSVYKNTSRNVSGSSRSSSKTHASTENLQVQFKARPPTVLHKEPFIPAKSTKPLTELAPFDLNMTSRLQEREEYERRKKEKEEKLEYFRKLEEEERLKREEKEIAQLRKESEYKAKPIKKFKEVTIVPSSKVTVPISPKFARDLHTRKKNKENIPVNSDTTC